MTTTGPSRRQRSDAQQNAIAVVKAAKEVFARGGVDAPAKEITDLAGVGVGTMYRHFPRRSDLVAAVMANEIDACADAAQALATAAKPGEALTQWAELYFDLVATKRGLAAALTSDDPGLQEIGPSVRDRLEPALQSLLDAARRTGAIHSELEAKGVITALALLCHPVPDEGVDFNRRLIAVFLNGLLVP
ncbi:TetR family transcriptional regulator [Frondihabitans sucicola]|uniref:TetR family transcriptional regulator n=1 Tax=Frondihabitans sucicola TaxID=1268041 RepID=A0ABM8GQM5_9MICO|nr:TetR/AcrR family transcriptional regulator [Frondihabitans sucicola]BDZ50756.1 TetR family transcriptional regulator [Frondihabitans sucicola]